MWLPSYPPTSSERRACETTSHQPAATSQQQPASCSQSAKPASQPSQPAKPAKPASQASQRCIRASKPQASRHRCLQTLNIGASNRFPQAGTGRHRLPQPATARQTFWHPQHRGAAKHAINPSNIDDMANLPANHVGGVFRQPDQPATRQGRTRGSPPLPPSLNPQS